MLPAQHAGFEVLFHKGSMEEHKPFHQPVSFRDTYEVDGVASSQRGVSQVTQGTLDEYPCCPIFFVGGFFFFLVVSSLLVHTDNGGTHWPPGSEKVCKTGKNLPGQIQISWTILVRNNASVDIF